MTWLAIVVSISGCAYFSFSFDPRDTIFGAAETLANTFGFQDDNVRNQVEHLLTLLSNHRRYATEMPAMSFG